MSNTVNLNNSGTPLRVKYADIFKYRQILSTNEEVQTNLAKDMHGRWVGPVPYKDFFGFFMRVCVESLKKYEEMRATIKFKGPSAEDTGTDGNQKESKLYAAFASFVHDHGLSPFMPFFISADKKKTNTDKRPDGGLGEKTTGEENATNNDEPKSKKELVMVPPSHSYNTRLKAGVIERKSLQEKEEEEEDGGEERDIDIDPDVLKCRVFNWALDTLIVEFKASSSDDPFFTEDALKQLLKAKPKVSKPEDAKPEDSVTFEKSTGDAPKIRGQLAVYAYHMFNHQQRTHLFQLLITGQYARFIYFDHSGAIVSERFDYTEQPDILGEFFWRMNYMTAEDRGMDTTAVKADVSEKAFFEGRMEQLLAKMKNPSDPQRDIPNAHPQGRDDYPVYKMTVHDDIPEGLEAKKGVKEQQYMELLVQRPIFDTDTPLGRATRGYIAFELRKEKGGTTDETTSNLGKGPKFELFLKDTWRVNHPLLKAETHMYRLLEFYGVPHVPRVICGGDVRDANGNTQDTICREWAKRVQKRLGAIDFGDMRDHRHHRIVQRLAYMIESARNSKEMTQAFCNILEVISELSKLDKKILHRDISVGNVMFEEVEGEIMGLLGDWDHATEAVPDANYEHQSFRTGTWAFMSIAILSNPRKVHEIIDDLESSFWTFLFAALHRFDHESDFNMAVFTDYSDEHHGGVPTGRVLGGEYKQKALGNLSKKVEFKCKPLQDLLVALADKLHEYYYLDERFVTREIRFKKDPTDPEVKEEYEDARTARDKLYGLLSDPSWWIKQFQRFLNKGGWIDDVATREIYPERTKKQEVQLFDMNSRTSFLPNLPAAANPNAAQAPVTPQAKTDGSNSIYGRDLPLQRERKKMLNDPHLRPFHTAPSSSHYMGDAGSDNPPSSPSFDASIRRKRARAARELEGNLSQKRLRSTSDIPSYEQPLPEIAHTDRLATTSSGERSVDSNAGASRSSRVTARLPTQRKDKGKGVDRRINKSTDI